MNTPKNISESLNNSFTAETQDIKEICNSFGCLNKATAKIVLPISSKSVTIFICENCVSKFEDNYTI
jgi:hypothetical protein